MSHWTLIAVSYALTLGATAAVVLQSWRAMRRAEADAEAIGRRG